MQIQDLFPVLGPWPFFLDWDSVTVGARQAIPCTGATGNQLAVCLLKPRCPQPRIASVLREELLFLIYTEMSGALAGAP